MPARKQPPIYSAGIPHRINPHTRGRVATTREEYGAQDLEDQTNVAADSTFYEPEEQRHAGQIMLGDSELLLGLDDWAQSFNLVPGDAGAVGEGIAHPTMSIDDLFPLNVNYWDIASSQSQSQQQSQSQSQVLHGHLLPPLLPSSPQNQQPQTDPSSPSTASPAQQSSFIPLYSSQPLQHHQQQQPPQPSPLSPSSEAVSSEDNDLKRLRNTAASARFRVKKKLREQSLERSTQQKREKLAALEEKVRQLEMENRWLKGLIIEREV